MAEAKKVPLMEIHELKAYFNVHEMTIYRWAKSGVIPGFKLGGRWRFKKELIEAFILKKTFADRGMSA